MEPTSFRAAVERLQREICTLGKAKELNLWRTQVSCLLVAKICHIESKVISSGALASIRERDQSMH